MPKRSSLMSIAAIIVAAVDIVAITIVAIAWISTVAAAQGAGASIDAGGLSMRYADSVNANAFAITPSLWSESRLTSLNATGTLSQFTAGGWSAQGSADASLFTRRSGFFLGELEGSGGGSAHKDGARTGQLLGSGRLHVASQNRGAWIGGGLGRTWDGATWRSVRQGEGAAWARFGSAIAFASATPVVVDDSIRYTDAQLSASINLPRVELSGSGGLRGGSRLPTLGGTAKSWGSVSVTGWIASRFALVASAGTYPVDLTQGFPGGRFAALSLRFGSRRSLPLDASVGELKDLRAVAPPGPRAVSGMSRFQTRNIGGDVRELRVHAANATSVELMGDFTGWQAVALQDSGDGWWTVSLPVMKGIHELNLRMNGGPWVTPPGLTAKSDEFGGSVGILIVR